jgi:hypothetical protein
MRVNKVQVKNEELGDKYQNSQVQNGQSPSYPKKCLGVACIKIDS